MAFTFLMTAIIQVIGELFMTSPSRDTEGGVPGAHQAERPLQGQWPSPGGPTLCTGGWVWAELLPPSLLLPFLELAGTAEKPQLKEGLHCEQDLAAQLGPQKKPAMQQLHRMFLLRVKLMHFVNSLHNYIMTRVRVCLLPLTGLLPIRTWHLVCGDSHPQVCQLVWGEMRKKPPDYILWSWKQEVTHHK